MPAPDQPVLCGATPTLPMPSPPSRFFSTRFSPFLGALLLLAFGARAQRAEGGQPAADPFGHPAAPEVAGERYKSHKVVWDYDTTRGQVTRVMLDVQATDGSTRRIQTWAPGVVKISYFAPNRKLVADSSVIHAGSRKPCAGTGAMPKATPCLLALYVAEVAGKHQVLRRLE